MAYIFSIHCRPESFGYLSGYWKYLFLYSHPTMRYFLPRYITSHKLSIFLSFSCILHTDSLCIHVQEVFFPNTSPNVFNWCLKNFPKSTVNSKIQIYSLKLTSLLPVFNSTPASLVQALFLLVHDFFFPGQTLTMSALYQ